jgi:ABC-2 type transport system ATP-binding protein
MNIYINDLSKYYKNKKALDHITLHLSSGIYGLIGPNGAGKTTFLSILCGLIKNDSGTIEIDEVKFLSDDFYHVFGYVPQSPALYVDLTCNEFLEYICALKSIDKNQIDHTLRLVNLYDQKYIKIKKLSGGMKQRLSIAQAIINDPQILRQPHPAPHTADAAHQNTKHLVADPVPGSVCKVLSPHPANSFSFLRA